MPLKLVIGFLAQRPMTALSIYALIGILLIAGQMYRVFEETGYRASLEAAASYSTSISDFREYYSSQVVPRARAAGINTSHDYRHLETAIPLPATLTIEIGEKSSSRQSGGDFRMFSSYPFPWRKTGGPHNDQEREVLASLETGELKEFVAVENIEGTNFLRYAIPVRMKESCVSCHNNHAESPRKDWRVGDVRGVQSVRLPIPSLFQTLKDANFSMFVFIFAGFIGGLMIFCLLLRHLQGALVQANKANRAKSDFLASMSHELRTPLNAIQGFSEMMKFRSFGPLGSEKYEEYVGHIHSSSEHLLNLVNDVLDLSTIEAGEVTLTKKVIEVEELINDCSRFIVGTARKKNIKYSVAIPHNLTPLHADERALKQILINLLSNSAKYTSNGGQIHLSVKMINGHHIFQIRDDGIGISKKRLKGVTDPFFREKSDPHKAQEGTGLGLAIVKSLVDLHDGKLTIQSEINQGTVVTVSLPTDITEQVWSHDTQNPIIRSRDTVLAD